MNRAPPGQVRIIAGTLRGSKLPVADRPGLRPTSDRIRETVFNWLQSHIAGLRVLDLFAGTGALGFEAASRGAAEVVMLERDPQLATALRANAERLKTTMVRVECADALAWLAQPPEPRFDLARFDLVFLDPPFSADLWTATAQALSPWLAEDALIYLESGHAAEIDLPQGWQMWREGRTREVRYALYRERSTQRR
jgi:16S rRNA (guanine966-N2)-methyltransferase